MSFSSHFARFSLTKVAGGMSRSNVQIVLGSIHSFTPCSSLYGKARLHEKLIFSSLSVTSHAIPEIIGFLQLQNNIRITGITRILSTLFISSRKRKNTLDILREAKWKLYSTTNLHPNADLNDDYLLFTAPIKSKACKIPHGSYHIRLQSDDTVEVYLTSAAEFQSQILPEVPSWKTKKFQTQRQIQN